MTVEQKENHQIATTILQQLGGRRFLVMTGANRLEAGNKCLLMRLRRNKTNSNRLKIQLNSLDTYDMRFSKVTSKGETKSIREYNDVYADMLQQLFTAHTGMYTSL
tara:strand:+ start:133 stop:450 length:318 start_codon:yes stop_codon:yes gene_type:complete